MSEASVVLANRYRLDARIAAGGIGEVWRARDLVLDRPVAVKVLRPEYAGQPQALARFRAEARQAGSVSHPGIAQVYDYGEGGAAAAPYLVMELVNGPSLAEVLAAGPLDAASALDVLAQTAAGLHAAHAAGLVHRDIKPANLVLGPGGQVKITDFGIAHAAGSAPITRTGLVIGTPAYLAPEQVAGDPATEASDLYALGVVGYECLTGAPPFRGAPADVAAAHRHQPLPPLPTSVPAGAASLVAELTAKDPAAR
ncbi:MAG: serine/threonine-protein kinase, partial [Streptosporangiaceae bacterium]